MEGVGSRLGRASSRYGPAPVFTGPVRKWKKQWVHVTSSSTVVGNTSHSLSNNGNGNNNNNNASALLLCRWTPISSTHSGDSGKPEEPPRRKFRYTPIIALEEKKKEVAQKVDDEAQTSKANDSTVSATSKSDDIFEKLSIDNVFMEEIQEADEDQLAPQPSNKGHLDLDLCLTGRNDSHDSDRENEAKLGRVGSGGFWTLG